MHPNHTSVQPAKPRTMTIAVSMSVIACISVPSYAQQQAPGGGNPSDKSERAKVLLHKQKAAGDLHEVVRSCMNGKIKHVFNLTGTTTPEEVHYLCAEGMRLTIAAGKAPILETVKAYIGAQTRSISNHADRASVDPETFMNLYVNAALENKPAVTVRINENGYEVRLFPAIAYILSYAYAALNSKVIIAGIETATHQDTIDSLWLVKIPAGGIRHSALAGAQQARKDSAREQR